MRVNKRNMKYDITKPMPFKVGLYQLNKNPDFNFQLNRLVNMDGADLELVQDIAARIHDNESWKSVLLKRAEDLDSEGDIKNAMAFYRMAEFYMEWNDPDAMRSWKRARELFFSFYADYFSGQHPVDEQFEIPYDSYSMPCLKLNSCHPDAFTYVSENKGTIIMNGGFDSSFEEFFPPMEYLRENGYTVYLFEGPGQGACIRLYGAPLAMEWEKPVRTVLDFFDLSDVCLIGASLGGYYSPRAAAFEKRITSFVSWPAFPSLRANMNASWKGSWKILGFVTKHFASTLDRCYQKGKPASLKRFLKTYYHRLGCESVSGLMKIFESMDMASFGRQITQDALLLGAEKDDIVRPGIAEEQKNAMPNARSVTVRILTEADQASDHCNCGNQKLAMDVVLNWLERIRSSCGR